MLKRKWLFTVTLIFAFLLSGCTVLIHPLVQEWYTITSVATVETTGPTEPTEVTVPAVACPEPTDGTELLKQSRHGYCLLYPQEYSVLRVNEVQTSILIGGLSDVSTPRLHLMVEEANGRTAESAADDLQFDYTPGPDIVRTNITVAGQDAVVLDHVPGYVVSRRVVFVHKDRLYHLIFEPADPALGEIYERMEALYETTIGSFTPIPVVEPNVNEPSTLCPEPTGNDQLLVNEREGYCVLYPNGYTVEQPSDGVTVLVVDGLLDAEHARAHIEVEDALGRTAEDVATALVEEFPGFDLKVSFNHLVVGGEPGFLVDGVPGQEINRQILFQHDGRLYKFLFAPADPARGRPTSRWKNSTTP